MAQDLAAVKEFFDARAAGWDETCFHDPARLAAVAALAQVHPGSRVLDIACGTGVMAPALLAFGPAKVTGVDLSDRMIAQARRKVRDPRVEFLACDVASLPGRGCYDVAVIYSAYPHFADRQALVHTVHRLLAPGGRFLVAHSEGRATINGRHHGPQVAAVSTPLRPAQQERAEWEALFRLDLLADTPQFYLLGGVAL